MQPPIMQGNTGAGIWAEVHGGFKQGFVTLVRECDSPNGFLGSLSLETSWRGSSET